MDEIKTSDKGNSVIQPLSDSVKKIPISWNKTTAITLAAAVALGVLSGIGVYLLNTSGTVRFGGRNVEVVKTPTEEGVKDAATFKDTATGMISANDGKITDEGTHILTRGDVSQNVYMTSSVIDLSKYEGKKVQVWGETFKGQKAGWLMSVGRIKVVS